ncbi:MAG: AmmeMemoRadiSam system radical SAM enzyme [Gammaproteobacteria bacterium]|nr:AmmeMemoRadiSam system radical SAM enzyme [Gammaproteobacteria bacterium]
MNTPIAAQPYPARWWHLTEDGKIQCDLCPRECKLNDGQKGLCFVRERQGSALILNTWGKSSGLCVDPVEKKPLNHYHPGSPILSLGTAGCNLACKFCQNWDISKSRDTDKLGQIATPEQIALSCKKLSVPLVAYTYNDPVIFAEYAMDIAQACHQHDIKSVAVTAGYIHPQPRQEFFQYMDAANIDLKGFNKDFYPKLCAAELQPVLDCLSYVKHHTKCWLEITTLLIPDANDSVPEIKAMCLWIYQELGDDVPLHFTAFHPDYKLRDRGATPVATLQLARQIAIDQGLKYVYTGNVHDRQGGTTFCPECKKPLIVRDWHNLSQNLLRSGNQCPHCHCVISGHFPTRPVDWQPFGGRRFALKITT